MPRGEGSPRSVAPVFHYCCRWQSCHHLAISGTTWTLKIPKPFCTLRSPHAKPDTIIPHSLVSDTDDTSWTLKPPSIFSPCRLPPPSLSPDSDRNPDKDRTVPSLRQSRWNHSHLPKYAFPPGLYPQTPSSQPTTPLHTPSPCPNAPNPKLVQIETALPPLASSPPCIDTF